MIALEIPYFVNDRILTLLTLSCGGFLIAREQW